MEAQPKTTQDYRKAVEESKANRSNEYTQRSERVIVTSQVTQAIQAHIIKTALDNKSIDNIQTNEKMIKTQKDEQEMKSKNGYEFSRDVMIGFDDEYYGTNHNVRNCG